MTMTIKKALKGTALATSLSIATFGFAAMAEAKTKLTMYYPVAVGGPLTKIVDGLVADFEKENPDIDVEAIYAGNYNDARIKALAALKSGKPAQLSVMFSIDLYELIEQDAIVGVWRRINAICSPTGWQHMEACLLHQINQIEQKVDFDDFALFHPAKFTPTDVDFVACGRNREIILCKGTR